MLALLATLALADPPDVLSAGRWDPKVRAGLEQMIVDHGIGSPGYDPAHRPVATFDWDKTSAGGDVGDATVAWLDQKDNGTRAKQIADLCAAKGKVVCYGFEGEQIAGLDEREVRELGTAVIDDAIARGVLWPRPEVQDLIAALQRHGWDVWIVSASAQPIVAVFAQRYGIPADHVVGIDVARGADGKYTAALASPATFGQGKVDAIDKKIGVRPTFAAGDSEGDIQMLTAAKARLVFDHGDAALKAAIGPDWFVQPSFPEKK